MVNQVYKCNDTLAFTPDLTQGVKTYYFTRKGGVSEDIYSDGKLKASFASLNFHLDSADNSTNIIQNLRQVASCLHIDTAKKLYILDPEITEDTNIRFKDFSVVITKGYTILTNKQNLLIGSVTSDDHPIIIKAIGREGLPVASIVIGSAKALAANVIGKTIATMLKAYEIDYNSISIEVGPGLDSALYDVSIIGKNTDTTPTYIKAFKGSDYCHEWNNTKEETPKYVLDGEIKVNYEMLLLKALSLPIEVNFPNQTTVIFPGITEDKVSFSNIDTYQNTDFFSFARDKELLDKEAIAIDKDFAVEDLTDIDLAGYIGKHLTIVELE
jgi:copper oxidase (laccase) domain-containing protein